MIKTVEVLKSYGLPMSLIANLTWISLTSIRLVYSGNKELSPTLKKSMTEKMVKFLTDVSVSLDD